MIVSPKWVCSGAILLILAGCAAPPSGTGTMAQQPVPQQEDQVRDSVRSFLTVWLLDGSVEKALEFFGESSTRNPALLGGSCSSFIPSEERGSAKARRSGLKRFLLDFAGSDRRTNLAQVLDAEALPPLIDQLGERVVNDAESDLFAVARMTREELPSEENSAENGGLGEQLPEHFYATFVPIDGGIVYFLWVPEASEWKIHHAELVCM